jgi:prepilin-type N-terminal cleavage/methylation domain-containing protein/prepilin-type processing-associated H-X9-DG protein
MLEDPMLSGHCRRGFTLVEMLVVIGIIALLVAILLPIAWRVQEQARTVSCLSNMRQFAMAAHAYSQKYNGICLPAAWRNPIARTSGKHSWVDDESWPLILMNAGLIDAPRYDPARPNLHAQMRSPFYCPSGILEVTTIFSDLDASSPADRRDPVGAAGRICRSESTGISIVLWYGINGSTSTGLLNSAPALRVPLDGQQPTDFSALTRMATINRPSELVLFYDGLYMNLFSVNANRVNARHGNRKLTNLAFFDGHAATYRTEQLPGGFQATTSHFSLNTLNSSYATGPKWRLNQN